MSKMNVDLNPTRMIPETRAKLRESRLDPNATAYTKIYGRHAHRVIAEQMLGRKLKKGEVVHHIDHDKRNNDPLNLMIFKSQAEHSRWHANEKIDPERNYG